MNFHLIDSHAHVQFPAYDADRGAVIARSLDAGIGIINIGTQYSTSEDAVRLSEQYSEGVWATVGFHPGHVSPGTYRDPWELREKHEEQFDVDKFRELALHPKVVAVGECGLDFYRSPKGQRVEAIGQRQRDVFLAQIELAREARKPLVIHCRSAFTDLIAILAPSTLHLTPHGNGVIHFFSGSWEEAKKLLELGFYLSFGGVITFSRDYDGVVTNVPMDRLLVETDAPYVSPAPHRGKRNEPAYIVEIAKKIAELRGIPVEEVALQTTKNASILFRF